MTKKGMVVGPIEVQLPPTSPFALLFSLEGRERDWDTLFLKISPLGAWSSAEVLSRVILIISYVLLVDHCNTTTMSYD